MWQVDWVVRVRRQKGKRREREGTDDVERYEFTGTVWRSGKGSEKDERMEPALLILKLH